MSDKTSPTRLEKSLLSVFVRRLEGFPVGIELWDGTERNASPRKPIAVIKVRDRKALPHLVFNPDARFADDYCAGRVDIEGDMAALLAHIFETSGRRFWAGGAEEQGRAVGLRRVGGAARDLWRKLQLRWVSWLEANTRRRSRKNIHHHYDIGNDFYKLWLDSQLAYTCAYFPSASTGLEQAQQAKMDYICRKVQLRAGDRVVEAGCGWGALARHMARRYGASVRAYNISHEQVAYARQRAKEEGLAGQVEFVEDDYRSISGQFDVFVSVGMLEHVGLRQYGDLGEVIERSLNERGRGLLHFIGRDREYLLNAWIRRRIFPGAYPPTLRQALAILEPRGFSVLDVENIRLHYARTIELWLERFEKSSDLVMKMFDAPFVRAWRLYLAGSCAAFQTGWMQLFQVTFARTACNQIPWTRAHLYCGQPPDSATRIEVPGLEEVNRHATV